MKFSYIIRLLLILALGSACILSSTLARYTDEYTASDSALVAKWNFRVGSSADNLHNLGFTFDVFGGEALQPQDYGDNTFFISGGESDVAIDYQVYMNVQVLQTDIGWSTSADDDYPPLIFRIESDSETAEATIEDPYDTWFDLQDIAADEEGYFLIASGHLEANSEELVPITIYWWWNTSYYTGTPNPDQSDTGNYYAEAVADYNILVNRYDACVHDANAFFQDHQRIVTNVVEGEETFTVVTYQCIEGCPYSGDEAHMNAYQDLRDDVDDAEDAIDNSWKVKYDQYDTKALSALRNLESSSPQSIMIKVSGEQVAPAEL
ncbi:MAG: hypothetical protein GX119_01925 [Syntrophomonadaceae bacterium]|jgi:hypothetical protein|nr:hypothetical protein [Syntrophomonadaceae bacterium]